jgi:predicted short-subunit dehydrogenase-like oxidoreductase (DUF2520 family)
MARSLSIVGAGRVGATLAKRLRSLGWRIDAVVTRSSRTARAAVRAVGAGTPFSALSAPALKAILAADVILITTPDDSLASVAHTLAKIGAPSRRAWRGKVVLHASGALGRTVLAPLARLGAATGSLHPMQTFSGRDVHNRHNGHNGPALEGVTFAIEGDAHARRTARAIVRALGGVPVAIEGRDKPAYHATAVLAAGSGFALIEASVQILQRLGFSRRRALQTLLPLIRQMLDNIERLGPRAAWTGPVSRGDYDVVARHARALRSQPPEFAQSYAALARLAGRVLSKNPEAALRGIERALQKSSGGSA